MAGEGDEVVFTAREGFLKFFEGSSDLRSAIGVCDEMDFFFFMLELLGSTFPKPSLQPQYWLASALSPFSIFSPTLTTP